MFQALLAKRVEAVVLGAPVLLYYATHEGKGRVKVVGPEFDVEPVAFTFQLESPLRKRVNGALFSLRENDGALSEHPCKTLRCDARAGRQDLFICVGGGFGYGSHTSWMRGFPDIARQRMGRALAGAINL